MDRTKTTMTPKRKWARLAVHLTAERTAPGSLRKWFEQALARTKSYAATDSATCPAAWDFRGQRVTCLDSKGHAGAHAGLIDPATLRSDR